MVLFQGQLCASAGGSVGLRSAANLPLRSSPVPFLQSYEPYCKPQAFKSMLKDPIEKGGQQGERALGRLRAALEVRRSPCTASLSLSTPACSC